jgi:hypothetical protein
MEKKLFGGNHGTPFKNYLSALSQPIGVQLEQLLKNGSSQENAIAEVKNMFIIEPFNFDYKSAEIRDTGSNNYETIQHGGNTKKIYTHRFEYKIPFAGDTNLIEYRPEIFHGGDRTADISTGGPSSLNYLKVSFRSEQNNQKNFDHEKSESVGELLQNCREINKEIKQWNEQIDSVIERVLPKVLAHIKESEDFKKQNNIKD